MSPRGYCGVLRVVPCVPWATTVAPALSVSRWWRVLAAFEAVLVFGAGAIGIPGVLLVRFADKGGDGQAMPSVAALDGGESFIAKLARAGRACKANACRSSGRAASTVAPAGEPRLDGLADIPLKPWVSEKPKADEAKPDAPKAVRRERRREGGVALGCGRALSAFARRRCGR